MVELVAWFECTETIDDFVNGFGWYYIGCGVCHTKETKGLTTLMCKKCGKSEIISVYDHKDQAVFVLLGDSEEELIGKKASELAETYHQANERVGEDHIVPVPQAIFDTIAPETNGNLGVNADEDLDNKGEDHADEPVKRGADEI
ncbi:unnamed protein product [Eruca vesicaria subsp. sativa]|uniref:Replication factor A C-terminal domain-containing protein n=1 Tax=Eruca vesicaria subsp. sativa TaxID=29727 RepID=A0ABC8JU07_ERUVS|nr:unnamed protein product [Eruca vesicaria subsp. sativa]